MKYGGHLGFLLIHSMYSALILFPMNRWTIYMSLDKMKQIVDYIWMDNYSYLAIIGENNCLLTAILKLKMDSLNVNGKTGTHIFMNQWCF